MFPTSDGHINIAASSGRLFTRFCEAIGQPEWLEKQEWKTQAGRSKDRKAINAAIGEITRTKPADHWIELFEANGIPCGPIYTIDQVFADPQVKHLGMATQMKQPADRGDSISSHRRSISPASPRPSARTRRTPARHGRDPEFGRLHRRGDRRYAGERSDLNGCRIVRHQPYAGGKMLAAKDDGVGLITFNQPEKRNAMSMEMWVGLGEILDEFARGSFGQRRRS